MQDNTKVTVYKHVEKSFSGELPILKVVDDKVSIDEAKLRGIAEELFKLCGTDAWKIFSGSAPAPKGKNAEVDIAKVTSVESPVVRDLKKRVGELEAELAQSKATYAEEIRTKDEEFKKAVEVWQKKLEQLKVKRAKKACEELAAEMEKKVIVTESIRSVEPEHLARDFFLDDSNGGKKYKERFIECISDLVMVKSLPECFHIKKHLPIDMVGKWCYYSYQHTEKVGNNMINIFEELVRHNFRFGRMCSRDYCRNLVNTLTIGRR